MLIKTFLIVLIVISPCCKDVSSVINFTYSEQQQFSHISLIFVSKAGAYLRGAILKKNDYFQNCIQYDNNYSSIIDIYFFETFSTLT